MSEAAAGAAPDKALGQLKNVPGDIKRFPYMAIGIGLLFLVLVLIVEAYKPGVITGPIRALLRGLGLKSA